VLPFSCHLLTVGVINVKRINAKHFRLNLKHAYIRYISYLKMLTMWLLVLVCLGQMRENFCFIDVYGYLGPYFFHMNYLKNTSNMKNSILKFQDVYYGIGHGFSFSWWNSPPSIFYSLETGSDVSTSCLKGCVRNYENYHGKYNTKTNNGRHFVNVLKNVLRTTRKGYCPRWCMDKNQGKDQCYEQTNNWWICNIRVCLFITDLQLYVKHSLHCCWIKIECLYLYIFCIILFDIHVTFTHVLIINTIAKFKVRIKLLKKFSW